MLENPVYNSKTDLSPVVEGLSLDLREAVETGVVKSTGTIDSYNGIENTEDIIGRVRDNFDSMDAMASYMSVKSDKGVNSVGSEAK